jgi:Icc-related predicted phosphoesterase
MKILALTDIHGSYQKAKQIITHVSPDVVVIGGDLTTVGSVKEAEEALRQFQEICPRIFCIAGNMDLPAHDELCTRLNVSLNGRGIIIDGVGFFGVSAAPLSPLHTPYEISEEEITQRINHGYEHVKQSAIKVFVPHAPPYGTKVDIIHSGIHVGSTAVREFIEEEKPHVVICGHIHEARGQDTIESSRIVNCGMAAKGYYAIIDISRQIEILSKQFTD